MQRIHQCFDLDWTRVCDARHSAMGECVKEHKTHARAQPEHRRSIMWSFSNPHSKDVTLQGWDK